MPTTPTSSRTKALNLDALVLSPTTFTRSPRTPTTVASSSPKVQQIQTRLLAIVRRLLESYSTWQLGHEKGTRFCGQLESLKLKLLDKAAKDEEASVFSAELSTWHQRLQVVMEVFVDIVKNASEAVHQLRALEQLQPKEDKEAIICRTWPISRFVAVADQLLNHFVQELRVKEMVFREICHRTESSHVTLTACAWFYPRFVGRESRFLVKCLTTECGLPDIESLANKGGGGGQ